MGKNNKNKRAGLIPVELVRDAQDSLSTALKYDVKYSLEPDPTGLLKLDSAQKNFIKAYIEFRSIPTAAQVADIDEALAQKYFFDETCRSEIRRINLALYYRKFSRRLLTIDEIGGYLTSLLTDEDINENDRLTNKDKLQVAKMIIDLNQIKANAYKNPRTIENVEFVEEEIKDLSTDQIRQIIAQTKNPSKEQKEAAATDMSKKQELLRKLNATGYFDPSEIDYLKTCSIDELEKLVADNEEIITKNEKEQTENEEPQ